MKTATPARGMFVAAAAMIALCSGTAAGADPRVACVAAAEQAQALRDSGKYREAHDQLLLCVRDSCPTVIKRDCGRWLGELETVAPTVVVSAKADSRDLLDVKVYLDGTLVLETLDGKPIPTDPGPHTFKFEWSGQTREERVLISAGQKGRNIVVSFGSTVPASASASTAAPALSPAPAPRVEKTRQGSLVPALVVGAVGVVGLTSFAFFGLSGSSEASDLRQTCKPTCTDDQVDSTRAKLLIADVSLGVGLVALGVATYMILQRPKVDVDNATVKAGLRSLRFQVSPTFGGAAGSLGARF